MWMVVDRDEGTPLWHMSSYLVNTARFEPLLGFKVSPFVFEFKNRWVRHALDLALFAAEGLKVMDRFAEPDFLAQIDAGQREAATAALDHARSIRDRDFHDDSSNALNTAFQTTYTQMRELNRWGHIINLPDFAHFSLSNRVLELLSGAIARSKSSMSAAEAFSVLATPFEPSVAQQHDLSLYQLLGLIQADAAATTLFGQDIQTILAQLPTFPAIAAAIDQHRQRYDWLQFHYAGPTILDLAYFVDLLRSELAQGTDGKTIVQRMETTLQDTQQRQQDIVTELALTTEEQHWVRVAQSCLYLKGLRKDTAFEVARCSEPLFRELGRLFALSRYQVRHLLAEEIETALLHDQPIDADAINTRLRHSIWIPNDEKITVLTGTEANTFAGTLVEETVDTEGTELTGTPAFAGRARGTVRLILRAEDMPKMNEGDILVSMATNPNIVPAMKKAAAIVTDTGGVTCHAAIVSRELQIPCVIGTKVATRWLKDGDLVEVDATNGFVRKILDPGRDTE